MNFIVRQMNVCLIAITLSSYWSAIKPTESHVLLLIDKLSPNSTTNANEEASLHFHRLANTHHLHNPCSPGRHSSAHPRRANPTTGSDHDISYSELTGMTALTALTGTPGNKPGLALLRELITKSTFLQGLVTNVIRMNLVEECTELRLPVVADVPNLDELKEIKLLDSMQWLYTSLTNQTAHTFWIWDKQHNYNRHNCSVHKAADAPLSHHNPRNHSKILAQHYWTIAINLRDLMCLFNQVLDTFNIDLKLMEATDRVLKHSVTDTPICSRKAVLDCQILKSSILLLENMSDYLRHQTVQLVNIKT